MTWPVSVCTWLALNKTSSPGCWWQLAQKDSLLWVDLDILDLFSVYEQYHQIPNTSLLTYLPNPMHEWNLICSGIFLNPKLGTCTAFVLWSKCLKLRVHQMKYGSILVSKVYRKRKERRIGDLCSQLMDALRGQIISDGLEWVWTQVMLKTHLRTVHISFLSAMSRISYTGYEHRCDGMVKRCVCSISVHCVQRIVFRSCEQKA